jgi:sn-glycerol 3-phosphate transport system permease protein
MYRTKFFDHLILIAGVILMLGPLVVAFTTSTHTAAQIHTDGLMLSIGDHFTETYEKVLFRSASPVR